MMTPVSHIPVQPWMQEESCVRVMTALSEFALRGGLPSPAALFVGGCVRNVLAGKAVADVDIATILLPDQVKAALEQAGIKVVPTGIEHGTVTAVYRKHTFEVTTLRRDVSTDGRRAVVAFTQDWSEDALRRDFTLNALYADLSGQVFDPTGEGYADALAGRVRFVGDPHQRIREDYLRVLRFFRMSALYGHGGMDAAGLAACSEEAVGVDRLSRERVTQEVSRLLLVDNPVDILGIMFEAGVLSWLLDEAYQPEVLAGLVRRQAALGRVSWPARLAALGARDSAWFERVGPRLSLSRAEQRLISLLCSERASDLKSLRVVAYRLGHEVADQMLCFQNASQSIDTELEFLNWTPPAFPIGGADVRAAGGPEGVAMGRVLTAVESWWIEQDFVPDAAACRTRLAEVLSS